jgi:AAA domain
MKFQDIPTQPLSVRIKSTDGSSFEGRFAGSTSVLPVARIVPNVAPSTFDLALSDSIVSVTSVSEADAQRLNSELSTGRAMLAQLSDLAPDGSVELRIAFFSGYMAEMGDVEIGVDDYVENRYRRICNRPSGDIYAWLGEQCTFKLGDQSYFFLTAGPAIEEELRPDSDDTGHTETESSDETSEEQDEADAELDEQPPLPEESRPRTDPPSFRNSFCVTGSDILFVVTTRSLPGGESIYVPSKLKVRRNGSDKAIRLAKGTLKFLDCTRTGRIQLQAKAQLSALTAEESSYLRKWDEFGEHEGGILLGKSRAIGALEFTQPSPERDGTVSVRIISDITQAARDALSNREIQLEVVDAVPEYIANPALSFAEFSQALFLKAKAEEPDAEGSAKDRDRVRYFEVEHYDGETKTLTLKTENVPQVGTLVLSMAGELAQIKRRIEARRAILQGRSANPQLGPLIEEKGEITSLRSPQKVKPLTRFVRQKVFRNPPTPMQERAIDVALNTPDIALIQGPPGTGKTTVIAAILERLNEIAPHSGTNGPGQVLLSGFQHDAVENMIDRISLNGIPVPKFGKRSGAKEDDMNAFEKRLEDWCGEIAQELRAKNPQIAELDEERAIRDLYKQYLRTPTHKLAATLVERIAAVNLSILGEDLSRRAARLAKRLATEELLKTDQNRHLLVVLRIRIRPESFADDGPKRAEDALVDLADLEDALDTEQSDLLEEASAWRHEKGTPPFLSELRELKRSLLVRLTAPPVFRVEKHSDEVLSLAEAAVKQISAKGQSATDKKATALAEFLAELENDPFGMIDAVSDFSYAFSATVQQSVNTGMLRRKGIRNGDSDESLEFEYTIIDEAARVSPRDLMIPMARGKKIILVGDHRQLPHTIDEEVAALMEEGKEDSDESDWLKKSMFEYLFSERLKALEEKDGIQRRVTLDKQFRMHPQLGDFVSRNFYEWFDRAERFESGLPENLFAHNLSGTDNKPAMWLNVPVSAGHGRRSKTSWIRPAEAEAIASRLRDWIESPEGSKLSYGVISFYKAQADLIGRELERQLGPIAKQVRAGTVDSFQGMEFDVVFLSVVRTIPEGWTPRDQDPKRQARSLFGHLCLYNRLNVSMSRQKKLLVAVGDSELVTNDLAADFIPGLVDFYKLAGGSRPTKPTRGPSPSLGPVRGPAPGPGPRPGPGRPTLTVFGGARSAVGEAPSEVGTYTVPSPVMPDVEEEKAPPPDEQPLINFHYFASQAGIDNPDFFITTLRALGRDPGERYQTYEQWWKEVFPGVTLRKPRSGGAG